MLMTDPDFPLLETLMAGIGLVAYTCSSDGKEPSGHFGAWGFSGCAYFGNDFNPLRNPADAEEFALCAAHRMAHRAWCKREAEATKPEKSP